MAAESRRAEDARKAKEREDRAEAERLAVQQDLRDIKSQNVTLKSITSAIKDLPRKPLGDGHTYAALPNGTNVVVMSDGDISLALPVRISGIGHTSMSASVVAAATRKVPPDDG